MRLLKGRYDNMPLELWMLFSYPILGTSSLDARLIYLRTMLVAMESLRTGVTSVSDDVYEAPRQDIDRMDAVFQAYRDIGMRATVSGHVIDRTVSGFHARVVQHEVDHLDGILYPMRMTDLGKLGFEDVLFPDIATRPPAD